MRRKRKKEALLGSLVVLVLVVLGAMQYLAPSAEPTGAVTGKTDVYEQCLAHGKDKQGTWHWDWINKCREFVEAKEKAKGKANPRVYMNEDAYDEFIEKYGTVDEDQQ